MDNLFLIIFILSTLGIIVYAILSIVQLAKKDKTKTKNHIKFLGISFVVMIVSLVGFGITSDSVEITDDTEKLETVAQPKETKVTVENNEEAESDTKEAEEKAAAELKEKEAEEKAAAEQKAKEEAEKKAEEEAKAKAAKSEELSVNKVVEAFKSNDFMSFANAFYGLEASDRSNLYRETVEGAKVTWSGVITDLETIKDSIIIIGKTDAYNGADWTKLNQDHIELVPYVIVVEMNNPNVKTGLKKGDSITLSGEIGARGDVGMGYNWKLYKGEIVK